MSHQLIFYALRSDLKLIERQLLASEEFIIIDERSPTSVPRQMSSLVSADEPRPQSFLVREQDLNNVVTEFIEGREYYVVDSMRSPVIEVSAGPLKDKVLRRSRFYYVEGYWNASGWLTKEDSFRKWAARILRSAKKLVSKYEDEYVGPETMEWLKRGDGTLASF